MSPKISCPACEGTGHACVYCAGKGQIHESREASVIKGSWFRETREAAGEALVDVAARMDISPGYLSRLERGLEQWPDGERSIAVDACTCAERAPENLMDFHDVNRVLWMMGAPEAVEHIDPTRPYAWWCRKCGWPLTPLGRHFEIELGDMGDG